MRVKVKGLETVEIAGGFIRLDSLLKFTGEAETGGEAKWLITAGAVSVNGGKCIQRGKKVYPGSFVKCRGSIWAIARAPAEHDG
jgi:ribosome-associated protein